MQPELAKTIAEISFKVLQSEHETTKRVIAAVPAEHASWRPHEKAWTAAELAWHIATAEKFFLSGVAEGQFTAGGAPPPAPKSMAEISAFYEKEFPQALAKVQALAPEALARTINFHDVFTFPAAAYLDLTIRHSVHHRGQLSTYLRAMGAKVPSIYGGSADEPFQQPKKAEA